MSHISTNRFAVVGFVLILVLAGAATYFGVSAKASKREHPELPSAAEYSASAIVSAPDTQREALRDGQITQQEFEAAVQQTAACAKASGVDVQITPAAGLRPSALGFVASGTLADAQAAKGKLDSCRAAYLDRIETAWALQQAHAPDTQVTQAFVLLTSCMQKQGAVFADGSFSINDLNTLMLAVSSPSATETDRALFTQYQRCKSPAQEESGYTLP